MSFKSMAVAIFAECLGNVVLVKDENKPLPHYWKLPGGRSEYEEASDEAGARELEEETGIVVLPDEMSDVYEELRRDHTFHLFHAKTQSFEGLKERGDEGEIVKVFTKDRDEETPGLHALPQISPEESRAVVIREIHKDRWGNCRTVFFVKK